MNPKYPDITVQLSDKDSNAFVILALCRQAALKAGVSKEEISAFLEEAKADDFDHLVRTAMRWFDCA